MDLLWRQINEAIHRRDTQFVAQGIPRYLRAHRSSPGAMYEASEFYRKIADYTNALRVLPNEESFPYSFWRSDIATKLLLQQARILNILGASNYALRVVERIAREKRARSRIEMVEIYHCNCMYQDLYALIGPKFEVPETEPWHQDWLLHFYYSIALNGLGRYARAIEHVENIATRSQSPLIQAMAAGYRGQFLVQSGCPEEALSSLIEAKRFFCDNDTTSDHGILQKWLGICYLKLGRYAEASLALEMARKIFYRPGFKPEDWMEIILWQGRIPGLESKYASVVPRLAALGGRALDALSETDTPVVETEEIVFSVKGIGKKVKPRHIDRASEVVWNAGRAELGIDLVDELVCNLIYAGKWGIPQFRLYEILWPAELFSFGQHQKRLEQLVLRARNRGYGIIWKDLHLYFKSQDVSASGLPKNKVRGGSFLREHGEFRRSEVQSYFSISQSSAATLCREWVEAKLIRRISPALYKALVP